MYVDEEDGDSKENSYKDPNNESATLDRAKEAALDFVKAHPETQVFKKEPEHLHKSQSKSKNVTQNHTLNTQIKKVETKADKKASTPKDAVKKE